MKQTTARVAAIQMKCESENIQGNLLRAAAFVEEAAARGAKLVLLPELMPGGYTLTEAKSGKGVILFRKCPVWSIMAP